jgi:membrane-associated phospholipid phosphatase
MRTATVHRCLPALLALALIVACAPAHAAAPADSAAAPGAQFGRRDAWFGVAAVGTVLLVATQDAEWSESAHANGTRFALDLTADAKRLGDPVYVACGLLVTDVIVRAAGNRGAAAATERIAFSVAAAGVTTFVLKASFGRWRPSEAPGDPGRFEPFSGHYSFPSGHTSTAFSLVTALDAETRTRWVPAIGYPLVAITGWSRVRDLEHWPSDVIAGAAIGYWVGAKADAFAKRQWPRGLVFAAWPQPGGAALVAGARF